jgi:SAM-dependent methyltransferase
MIDPKARFSNLAESYSRYRPSYPDAALAWILEAAEIRREARVADLGCGTGIFSRQLAARGYRVTGIDPNAGMLTEARQLGGPVEYRCRAAESTGIPQGSVSLVTAAQSFHWFDLKPALAEIRRVLAPFGWAAALWNLRAPCPLLDAYEALLVAHSADYRDVPHGRETIERLKAAGVEDALQAEFPHAQRFDLQGLLGRAHSSSYVALGVKDVPAFDAELTALFERHARAGEIEFPYSTVVLLFRP